MKYKTIYRKKQLNNKRRSTIKKVRLNIVFYGENHLKNKIIKDITFKDIRRKINTVIVISISLKILGIKI